MTTVKRDPHQDIARYRHSLVAAFDVYFRILDISIEATTAETIKDIELPYNLKLNNDGDRYAVDNLLEKSGISTDTCKDY